MENIRLTGSPAALIAADDVEDDGADEAAPPVRFHAEAASDGADDDDGEPEAEQLSPEDKLLRRQLLRKIARYRALFPGEITTLMCQISTV